MYVPIPEPKLWLPDIIYFAVFYPIILTEGEHLNENSLSWINNG